MKKMILPLLLAGVMLTFGCNSNDSKTVVQPVQNDAATSSPSAAGTANDSATMQIAPKQEKEVMATAELCACVNTFLADMSPQVRQIIIKSSKSSTPMQTLATELQQVKGTAEQERLLRELEKFENDQQLQRCSEGIKQKYKLDENDQVSREKMLEAAREKKDCEVVYALMKIGLEQEENARANRN